MRHFVNYALLFFFIVLAISGLLSFIEPFKLLTTRIHIIFGFSVVILVLLHLAERLKYFGRSIKGTGTKRLPSGHFTAAFVVTLVILCATILNWWPIQSLIGLGYEARNKAVIFRSDSNTAFMKIDTGAVMMHAPEGAAHVRLEIEWGSSHLKHSDPEIAIWAENTTGMMINTFFVSEKSAYSDTILWEGIEQSRANILPVWRHRYTLLSGVDPEGNLDGKSAATPEHSFAIEEYLQAGAKPFYIYAEVNMPEDDQPSVLYGAYIETTAQKEYYLLPLVAHSGDKNNPTGHLYYDLDQLTTAKDIIEKILVRVVRQWE